MAYEHGRPFKNPNLFSAELNTGLSLCIKDSILLEYFEQHAGL